MSQTESLTESFQQYAAERLQDALTQIERCLSQLTVDQIWHRPNDVSNAVGNLVLHLNGNVRQWIVSGLGRESFERDRPAEFARREPIPTEEILSALRETVNQAVEVISALDTEALIAEVAIQGYCVTGLAAVFHVVEHFSLHTGQIVYATKLLTGRELSLYDAQGRRLDGRSEGTP